MLRTSVLLPFVFSLAQTLAMGAGDDALAIMTKAAASTSSAAETRRQYVYRQRVRSSLLRGSEAICRESREYTVTPQNKTTEKKLVSFSGECRQGKQMVPYSQPAGQAPGLREREAGDKDSDASDSRATIGGVMNDMASDPHSRDGIPRQLFPLSPDELKYYKFTLKGETTVKDRRAYDIRFEPIVHKGICFDHGEEGSPQHIHADLGEKEASADDSCFRPWKGEVWVDAEDYQPIRIDTQLSKGIPWGVRVFLGINIRQLGFSLTYQRVADGLWFPATYGTEFGITVFWGYKRTITMSMENSDFRKTDAQSTIQFDSPDQ
ncbi:MAG TPA: hypothetical protein VGL82_08460 [Bryobacteraceae bacterium]